MRNIVKAGGIVASVCIVSGCLYIKATYPDRFDDFGVDVAVTDVYLLTGSPREDSASRFINGEENDNSANDAGAAYLYQFTGSSLSLAAYLKPSNAGTGQRFGQSVDIQGNTIIIGASGEKSAGGNGSRPYDTSLINAGAAYIFERSISGWRQAAYLKAGFPDTHDQFGVSVAIAQLQQAVVVGAPGASSASSSVNVGENDNSMIWAGAAYVYEKFGSNWIQTAFLKPTIPDAHDRFGQAVAISGNGRRIVIGAYREQSSNGNPYQNSGYFYGAAYVFDNIGGQWQQSAYLKPIIPMQNESFGYEVAISDDGGTIAIGAPLLDTGTTEGILPRTYIFKPTSSGNWYQAQTLIPTRAQHNDKFGARIDFSPAGNRLIIGAPTEAGSGTGIDPTDNNDTAYYGTGAAYIYEYDGLRYNQVHYLKGFTSDKDNFGTGVTVSNRYIAIGLPGESSNETGIHDFDVDAGRFTNNSILFSGAVMLLDLENDF